MPILDVSIADLDEYIQAGDKKTIRVTVGCPVTSSYSIAVKPIDTIPDNDIELDTSMLPSTLVLNPGDTCILGLDITFHQPGPTSLDEIKLQASPVGGEDHLSELLSLGLTNCYVLPSLAQQLEVSLQFICRYDNAVKVAMELSYHGVDDLEMVEVNVGPLECMRSGISRRVYRRLAAGCKTSSEIVVASESIEVEIRAIWRGERLHYRATLVIPDSHNHHVRKFSEFCFLQPRNLTSDQVTIRGEEETNNVESRGGIYPVTGGKSRYLVTITPSKSNVSELKLLPAPGQVEVCAFKDKGTVFEITIVDSPVVRQTVRLIYTMTADGKHFQGEIYLSIVPTSMKLWLVAATVGGAVTIKGMIAVMAILFGADDNLGLYTRLGELIQNRGSDLTQLISIPLLRGGLGLLDHVARQFDGS